MFGNEDSRVYEYCVSVSSITWIIHYKAGGGGGVRCSAREIIHWHQGVGIVKVRKYAYLKSEASVWQKLVLKNKHFKCYKCKTFERCIWVVTRIIFKFIRRYAFYFNSSLHHNFTIKGKLISLLYWSTGFTFI